jgi:hypothetical protein
MSNLGFPREPAKRCLGALVCASAILSVSFALGTISQGAYAAPAKAAPKKRPGAGGKNYNSGECNAYLSRLSGRFENNWMMPDGRNVVTITAVLNQDGSTGDVSIKSSPSNKDAESAANEAFVKAQPFESLPTSAGTTAQLVVVFDSNADPHGDTSSQVKASLGPAPGVQQAPQQPPQEAPAQ